MLKELIREAKEKRRGENYTNNERIVLEQAWIKDKIAENTMCEKCKVKPANSLDHIIPRFILKSFGIDVDRHFDEDNYSAVCRFCNMQKMNNLDFTNPKTKPLLLKYLETV